MAQRKPLVLGDDGLAQQLQAGDTISAPTNAPSLRATTNGESAAAMTFGAPVYAATGTSVKRAQANAKATSKVAGLVYDASIAAGASGQINQSGIQTGTTAQWDAVVTGQSGGLTVGAYYFVDAANPGKLTATAPSTVGQCNVLVGQAISATDMEVDPLPPILL